MLMVAGVHRGVRDRRASPGCSWPRHRSTSPSTTPTTWSPTSTTSWSAALLYGMARPPPRPCYYWFPKFTRRGCLPEPAGQAAVLAAPGRVQPDLLRPVPGRPKRHAPAHRRLPASTRWDPANAGLHRRGRSSPAVSMLAVHLELPGARSGAASRPAMTPGRQQPEAGDQLTPTLHNFHHPPEIHSERPTRRLPPPPDPAYRQPPHRPRTQPGSGLRADDHVRSGMLLRVSIFGLRGRGWCTGSWT